MDLTLKRSSASEFGVFGELRDTAAGLVAVTLEHSFNNVAALPAGQYTCQRGMHTLHHHPTPFETFQIMDVPGHDKILFHVGNFNADSEGCVLLGTAVTSEKNAIGGSQIAFLKFLELQADVDIFSLTVYDIAPKEI